MKTLETINQKIALKITSAVGTMWCAYIFMVIALISLPNALKTHDTIVIVSWVAQTFLQLVLLSIIMVGQDVQSTKTQEIINETHFASLSEFELAKEARAIAQMELKELKSISREVHQVLRDIEGRLPQ